MMILRHHFFALKGVFFALKGVTLLALAVFACSGCTAVQRISEPGAGEVAYIRMDVEPSDTRIYVDAQYQGQVDGWAGRTVTLEPGLRQVELRAAGYITRRFDLELEAGGQSVLTVQMEASLERLDGEALKKSDGPETPAQKIRSLGVSR